MFGGLLVGFTLGKVLAFILVRVQKNNLVTIAFMLLVPFVTYQVAEELHVSGVIAVVILGLMISRFSNKVFPENLKQQSKSFWDVIVFLLNGLIFILIGLPFPDIIRQIDKGTAGTYLSYALIITIVALALRMARVFLQQVSYRKSVSIKKEKDHRKRIA